ncbi:MAG: metalloregulator ArsR/SmtB family transcription factor [Myxococcota bacterium]
MTFFKALADSNRLRIVGLLAHRPHSVDELATVLELRPSTVSHHASKLVDAGLVTGAVQGHYHIYSLRLDALQKTAKLLLSERALQDITEDGTDAYDRKVLNAFLNEDGRISSLPMKRKKFDVLLRHALSLFEEEGEWPEREINCRLKMLTDDVASIRRGFIDHGYMVRNQSGSIYLRTEQGRGREIATNIENRGALQRDSG